MLILFHANVTGAHEEALWPRRRSCSSTAVLFKIVFVSGIVGEVVGSKRWGGGDVSYSSRVEGLLLSKLLD